MSVLNQSGEELVECPLCMEPLEVDDLHFYPCTCGYQICRFCWNRIREGENGLCPACRKAYPENPADFTPLSQEQVAAIKTEKKAREQKRRNKTLESRRALANVRVVQNNLVFVVGLPVRLADPEILKRQEYFGKYGKIHKVVINQSTTYAGQQGPSASAYVTYVTSADALRAIQGVNNVTLDGRVLKGSLGTTKYCANFMKNQPCPKPDCMYLHELGDPKASFTKEEMHAGLHQVYERKLHNQLLAATRDNKHDGSGNSSASESKSSSKDGNQSNFIPTAVVTSSNVNVVNSTKSKKERNDSNSNGNGNSNGNVNSNSNASANGNGKEAWPSLGSSPPSDSPARKQTSPKPQHSSGKERKINNKSQENGTSTSTSSTESSSPVQLQTQTQAQTKTKDSQDKPNRKENGTNGQKKKDKSKQKANSVSIEADNKEKHVEKEERETKTYTKTKTNTNTNTNTTTSTSVFESETQYLTNELDELESDRHSLLENHDLLDNSDHSLLDDDTHNLLNDANNEVMMMHRHKEMLAGLVENNLMPHIKSPVLNGYGLLDRDMGYLDRPISQMNSGLMDPKDLMMRERSQSELMMRQNEMMARQHSMMESKRYMPSSSIGLESASELLGANYHPNPNMLPPFGMRVDNSLGTSSLGGGLPPNMSPNMSANLSANMSGALGGFMLHGQPQQMQMQQTGLVNGYDAQQSNSEGRYLAENMDKFFTDFHKAQQMRLQLNRSTDDRRFRDHQYPQHMLSAERLEMEHKQRMSNVRGSDQGGHRAAGDGDDDLDFDPFKETQKAFAELMENEMMQNQISSGDTRRTRAAPPGFSNHVAPFGLGAPHHQPLPHQGFMNNNSSSRSMFSDWSQMDPAIMSVNFSKNQPPQPSLTHQQQELFARFNQLGVQPNGVKHGLASPAHWQPPAQKLSWTASPYNSIPLPPGFAPAKPAQHPAECIDAK